MRHPSESSPIPSARSGSAPDRYPGPAWRPWRLRDFRPILTTAHFRPGLFPNIQAPSPLLQLSLDTRGFASKRLEPRLWLEYPHAASSQAFGDITVEPLVGVHGDTPFQVGTLGIHDLVNVGMWLRLHARLELFFRHRAAVSDVASRRCSWRSGFAALSSLCPCFLAGCLFRALLARGALGLFTLLGLAFAFRPLPLPTFRLLSLLGSALGFHRLPVIFRLLTLLGFALAFRGSPLSALATLRGVSFGLPGRLLFRRFRHFRRLPHSARARLGRARRLGCPGGPLRTRRCLCLKG